MRLNRRRRRHTPAMNMTTMIDVVFQLLIFFMTCSQVSRVNSEPVELPLQPGVVEQQESALVINIDERERLLIGGYEVDVTGALKQVAAELARQGDNPSRVTVVLRVDRRAPSRVPNEIVTELTRMEIHRVRIAVKEPDP